MNLRIALGVFGCALGVLALAAFGAHLRFSQSEPLPPRSPDALRIASHNVHYIVLGQRGEGPWSVAGWEARRDALDAMVKELDADVLAFQEMESFQRGSDGSVNLARDFLLARNPGYSVAASGDWRSFPSTQPIFYRPERLTVLDQGWFFFSDTPDVIYSRTFNGSYPAFAAWVVFDTAQGPLRVVNLHTDAKSRANRRQTATLVAERVRPWLTAGERLVVLGDFNALRGAATLQVIAAEGITFLPSKGASFHLNRGFHPFAAIDHIALSAGLTAPRATILQKAYDGRYPSDHYPVVADVMMN